MRNDIEHVDGQVLDMTFNEGDPFFLVIQTDRVELYGDEIKYAGLADWGKAASPDRGIRRQLQGAGPAAATT